MKISLGPTKFHKGYGIAFSYCQYYPIEKKLLISSCYYSSVLSGTVAMVYSGAMPQLGWWDFSGSTKKEEGLA